MEQCLDITRDKFDAAEVTQGKIAEVLVKTCLDVVNSAQFVPFETSFLSRWIKGLLTKFLGVFVKSEWAFFLSYLAAGSVNLGCRGIRMVTVGICRVSASKDTCRFCVPFLFVYAVAVFSPTSVLIVYCFN